MSKSKKRQLSPPLESRDGRRGSRGPETVHAGESRRGRGGRGRVWWFVVVFVVLVAVGSAAEIWAIRQEQGGEYRGWITATEEWLAATTGVGLKLLGLPAEAHGSALSVKSGSVMVATECIGIRASVIFWAGVIGFPCGWRNRLIGLALGLFGVQFLNMLRIGLLGTVMGYWSQWFDPVHSVLMQGFLVVFVAPMWILWMLYVVKKDPVFAAIPPEEPRNVATVG